jgi:hypothetical protein
MVATVCYDPCTNQACNGVLVCRPLQADLPHDVNTSRVLYQVGVWKRNSRFQPIKQTRHDSATAARDHQWKQMARNGVIDALGFMDLYAE